MTREIIIKNRFNNKIMICGEYEDISDCVEKNKANLREADLYEADLRRADLYGADLRRANLYEANLRRANLYEADLYGADLRGADLYGADLRRADLYGADLYEADLRRANLYGANLRGADLYGADLRGAEYQEPLFLPDFYSLKLLPQDTKLTFWKYLKDGKSPYLNMEYKVGKEYKFKNYDSDEHQQCGEGGNVATLMWCLKDSLEANEFIECGFKVKDIVAIPYGTDGKFRVNKLKVLRKINREEAIELLKNAMKNNDV